MKRFGFFLLSLLVISSQLFAEDKEKKKSLPLKKNAIKLNITSLLVNNLGLQYERVVGPKISVACQIRYTVSQKIPLSNTVADMSNDSILAGNLKTGGWAITPEFRFYPRRAMKGFYLAPYLRFRNISLDFPVSYTDDQNQSQQVAISGNMNSMGGGLMIGSHYNLGKSISLDWFILGFQFMTSSGSFKGTTTETLSATDQVDIMSSLHQIKEDSKWGIKQFDYQVGNNSVSVDAKYSSLGFRGFGLNLGYRF
jgi:hypothetical protein